MQQVRLQSRVAASKYLLELSEIYSVLFEYRASPRLQKQEHERGLQPNSFEQQGVDELLLNLPRNPNLYHSLLLDRNALAADADEAKAFGVQHQQGTHEDLVETHKLAIHKPDNVCQGHPCAFLWSMERELISSRRRFPSRKFEIRAEDPHIAGGSGPTSGQLCDSLFRGFFHRAVALDRRVLLAPHPLVPAFLDKVEKGPGEAVELDHRARRAVIQHTCVSVVNEAPRGRHDEAAAAPGARTLFSRAWAAGATDVRAGRARALGTAQQAPVSCSSANRRCVCLLLQDPYLCGVCLLLQ